VLLSRGLRGRNLPNSSLAGEEVLGVRGSGEPLAQQAGTETAHLVRRELSAIGINVRIREVADLDRALRRGAKFDLVARKATVSPSPWAGCKGTLAHFDRVHVADRDIAEKLLRFQRDRPAGP
jgi:hypothetical protein